MRISLTGCDMHDEFLTALRENPNDDVSRLVYADWLDEQDNPLAQFLRLEVRLAASGRPDDQRAVVLDRLSELGRRAEPGWLLAVNRAPFVRCSVRKRTGRSPLDGTLELANYSLRALTITFEANVLQYLRLAITDPFGTTTDERYAEFPSIDARHLRLSPGERTSVRINLLHTIPVTELTVGMYAVQAEYVYDGVTSRADPVRVELTEDDRKMWKLGRYARG